MIVLITSELPEWIKIESVGNNLPKKELYSNFTDMTLVR